MTVTVEVDGVGLRLRVAGVGLACCALEAAVALVVPDPRRMPTARTSRVVQDVLVVSGTITVVAAPALARARQACPQGTAVLAYGACATSGGPYWDSYAVTNGTGVLFGVDVYVPGCPPSPAALLEGLRRIATIPGGGGR
ncbi:MAG: NADH-quinone oxidoreductase subunit B family protein [Actinomycetes bacterium]